MTEMGAGPRIKRHLGELLIVFVGVLLAFAADDFREARSERAEARQSLQLLLVDLAADSAGFARASEWYGDETTDIAWLVQNWHRDNVPIDSLEAGLYTFSNRWTLQLSASAYAGLESPNGLRLIPSSSLRQALLDFYRRRHPDIQRWDADTGGLHRTLVVDYLGTHVLNLPGAAPGSMWPPPEARVTLRTSWPELQSDAELHNVMVQLGRFIDTYASILAQGEEAATQLMVMIRAELGG